MFKKKLIPESLNICLISPKFTILGRAAEHSFLWPVAKGLVARGHKVTVFSSKSPLGKYEILQDGVRIFYLQQGLHYSAQLPFPESVKHKFLELHKENPFHLVHSLDASGFLIAKEKKKLGVAVAYDVEATHMSQLFSIMAMSQETIGSLVATSVAVAYKYLTTFLGKDSHLLKTADGVFVASPQQKVALERYYLYPEAKTYTIPYGIEISDLSPREFTIELRKKLNIPIDSKIVMTITDMTEFREMKGILEAFQKVAIKKPSSRLIVVGQGPLYKEIEGYVLNLALGSKVIMTGAVKNTEIPDYIALSDIYINISSRTTGFEPSILEAMAQKKVIIGSEMNPISIIVEDGVEGFLVRPADNGSIANLILQIFTGQLMTDEIGENARKKIINMFDTHKMVDQTIQAYCSLLK